MDPETFTVLPVNSLASSKRSQLCQGYGNPHYYVTVEGWAYLNNGGTVTYTVEVGLELEGCVMVFKREARYSEMLKLHNSLKNDKELTKKPDGFPPKKLIGNLDLAFVRNRHQELQKYMAQLSGIPDITRNQEFLNFFKFRALKDKWSTRCQEYQNQLLESSSSSDFIMINN